MLLRGWFDDLHTGEIDPGRYELQDPSNSKRVYGHIFVQKSPTGGVHYVDTILFNDYPGAHNVKIAYFINRNGNDLADVIAAAKSRGTPYRHDRYQGSNVAIVP